MKMLSPVAGSASLFSQAEGGDYGLLGACPGSRVVPLAEGGDFWPLGLCVTRPGRDQGV